MYTVPQRLYTVCATLVHGFGKSPGKGRNVCTRFWVAFGALGLFCGSDLGRNTCTRFWALRLGLNAFPGFGRCRFGALTWGATLLHGLGEHFYMVLRVLTKPCRTVALSPLPRMPHRGQKKNAPVGRCRGDFRRFIRLLWYLVAFVSKARLTASCGLVAWILCERGPSALNLSVYGPLYLVVQEVHVSARFVELDAPNVARFDKRTH